MLGLTALTIVFGRLKKCYRIESDNQDGQTCLVVTRCQSWRRCCTDVGLIKSCRSKSVKCTRRYVLAVDVRVLFTSSVDSRAKSWVTPEVLL